MREKEQLNLALDDIVRLKKPHPCGSYQWRVTRLGADIGLCCLICGRRLLLERGELRRRLVEITPNQENSNQVTSNQ